MRILSLVSRLKNSKEQRTKQSHSKAFTLVEILLVVAIIGILSAIVLVSIQGPQAAARDSRRQSDLAQIKKSLQSYYLAKNTYPITGDVISLEEDYASNGPFTQALKGQGFMRIIPKDPLYSSSGGNYSYKYLAIDPDYYILGAKSEAKDNYFYVDQDGSSREESIPEFGEWGGLEIFACGDDVVDSRDGKTYGTVLVGDQCWFSKNMNIGTMINYVNNQGTDCSSAASIEKYCYDNNESNCITDGGLYSWNQAMCGTSGNPRGICPEGWHIPSDYEFYVLENFLKNSGQTCDGNRVSAWDCFPAGANMRIGGLSNLNFPMSGERTQFGAIDNRGNMAFIWSSTPTSSYAWRRSISGWSEDRLYRSYVMLQRGNTIRCIQD